MPQTKPQIPPLPLGVGMVSDIGSANVNQIMSALKYNASKIDVNDWSTPKSPSPVREIVVHNPVVIPTEKIELE